MGTKQNDLQQYQQQAKRHSGPKFAVISKSHSLEKPLRTGNKPPIVQSWSLYSRENEGKRPPSRYPRILSSRKPALAEEVVIAFDGWVEQIAEGVATLRLVDGEGRRSVTTYAVSDLERDHIPTQVGTPFCCRVARQAGSYQITFQSVSRRSVSNDRRKHLEDQMIAAYATLKNDY